MPGTGCATNGWIAAHEVARPIASAATTTNRRISRHPLLRAGAKLVNGATLFAGRGADRRRPLIGWIREGLEQLSLHNTGGTTCGE